MVVFEKSQMKATIVLMTGRAMARIYGATLSLSCSFMRDGHFEDMKMLSQATLVAALD